MPDQRSLILNVFKPNSAVATPDSFAGRRHEVLRLADALHENGSCPIIYGARGLGKTSLAHQLALISLGHTELLHELGAPERSLDEHTHYSTFWVDCSTATTTKDALLQRLVNAAERYYEPSTQLTGMMRRRHVKLKFFEDETVKNYKSKGVGSYSRLNTEDQFLAVVDTFTQKTGRRVLFVIDELDRIADSHGLGSFIKSASSHDLKFLLVGIAQNISSLIVDHASLERHLIPVQVERMDRGQLTAIIRKAERLLVDMQLKIEFSPDAVKEIVDSASGFPWFVHVLGHECLKRVYDAGRSLVQHWDVRGAQKSLAQNRFAQHFADQYRLAVQDSPRREILLRLLAKWAPDDIPLGEIYSLARGLNVSNPSRLKTNLMSKRCGEILVEPPSHERGIVRFRNTSFKCYVEIVDSIFADVKDEVDHAWKKFEDA